VSVEGRTDREQQQARQVIAQASSEPAAQSCFGAAASTDPSRCPDSHVVRAGFGPESAATDGPGLWLAQNVAPQFADTQACPVAQSTLQSARVSVQRPTLDFHCRAGR